MLDLSINNGKLSIAGVDCLLGYQSAGLRFIGFTKISDSEYEHPSDTKKEILLELVEFLEFENVEYSLCEICKEFVNNHKNLKQEFDFLKQSVLEFKNGYFNDSEYKKFQNSVSKLIKRPLKEHQKKAAYHLYKLGNGANFSVPGSGKTSVVLSVYQKLKHEGKVDALFVVGPLSSFGPWKSEFEAVLGEVNCAVLAGGESEARKLRYYDSEQNNSELYLISFQTLLYDYLEVKHLFSHSKIKIFFVIDEAHYIKRIDGRWAEATLGLSSLASFRCILTGTPMPKSYTDIFNLFDFLWPGYDAISQDSKMKIINQEKSGNLDTAKQIVKQSIDPLFYRVRKKELGLKEQFFLEPIIVEMNFYERKIYDAIITKIEDYAKTDYANNIEFVSRLYRGRMIRLRQTISNVGLIRNSLDDYSEDLFSEKSDIKEIIETYNEIEVPAKIDFLVDYVGRLRKQKKKIVIWSNFVDTLMLIKQKLRENDFDSEVIYGGTPIDKEDSAKTETREKIRNRFIDESSGLDILIANPAACAESISLHKTCQDAIYYDLSYNCAQYLQSLDRIHRVGGSESKSSYYHFLQYKDTIDSDILQNLRVKAQKMYEIIDEDFNIYSLDMDEEEDDDIQAYKRLFK